jgi:hypothetical protein
VLLFEDVLTTDPREFKRYSINDIFSRDLGLEPEATIDIVVSFLLLIKHPTAAADHDVLPQFSEI